ncbi:imidazolonepropionase [Peribacillus frigoritolerans]|uniref:imidazolonepropionase n=1 Tax=Peribacillus frigoritolerans TaxID=450367 RepID=UPI0006C143AD|nr:imidazolonepropionase [Peribacillus frigoritolerans]KOR83295.1 imidazolonepropionase [Bacillus sp. FJAT-22058]AZV60115.1 imidazolonepropionase [Peribacillus frigoritolerans]USK82331.1 imidazolonepropionase [Peribacillus frigoritolerans]UZD48919.1 imidazolonepropionase [Peribacillus frigoritolerans]WJE49631.1 imidazolonepropionase [Peribacillus frigoritolerans]
MTKPIWIKHATQLATLSSERKGPRSKEGMSELGLIEDGSIWMESGLIQAVGTTKELEKLYADRMHEAEVFDATGHLVTPGLVDPHTHVVYGGSREREFEMRLEGATYMDIMNGGGGIHATTRMTREASEEELMEQTIRRLDSFLAHGVTTVEGKSGYGMNLETELKQLRVMKKLQEEHPIDLVPTFMGAHAVPKDYKGREDEFVDHLINDMLPIVAEEKLAEFNDVFCEKGVFTPEQSERILKAGKKYGLIPKIHADEIEPYGGAELAAKIGAISAEHLLKASEEGIQAMAKSGTIACLLPATALYLREDAAPGRRMVDEGVAVAISTDCNPGSSPTTSMPLVMNLACISMRLTPAEALTAATYNAACAINRQEKIGSVEVGKQADVVLWNVENYQELQYLFGVNHVKTVWKNGVQVVNDKVKSDSKSLTGL